jgi:2-polyprenyl-3-methyl-5-hydroxy-6-metoxy-1,4-benzoquinol methylase
MSAFDCSQPVEHGPMVLSLKTAPKSQPMITRHCPSCSASHAHRLWDKGGVPYVRCLPCGMVYANRVDAAFATGKFYNDRADGFYLSPTKLEADYDPIRFKREWALFRKWVPQGKVLDVGCSTGGFLKGLAGSDYELFGNDVSKGALEQASRVGIQVMPQPFLDIPPANSGFDAVTFWAVLEHVMEPRAFLEQAAQQLRVGGICIMLVPNLHSLVIRLLGSRYRYVVPEHINFFSPTTLTAMVERMGLWQREWLGSMHFNPVVLLQDAISPRNEVPDAERAGLLLRTNRWKKQAWLKPLQWAYENVEMCLGKHLAADNLVMVLRRR